MMNSIVVLLAAAASLASARGVSCDAKGVACMSSAACDSARGEVHPLGVCDVASAHVCCVVGVRPLVVDDEETLTKKKNALAQLSRAVRKRQFGGFLNNILNTVNTVKNVVNGVMMLSNLANGLNTLNNAANAVNMLANAVPTLPSLPTVPPLPPVTVPPFTVPPVPDYTIPPIAVPSNVPIPPATLPGPRTNPNSGLPIGVDSNNPLGLATNAAGQFINEHGVVVDRYGDLVKQQTNPTYLGVSQQPQFTQPPAPVGTQPNNAVPGGVVDNNAGEDEQLGTTMADSESGLGVGAYVGIGVVGLVCVVLLCVMVYCVASRSRDSTSYNVKNSSYDPQQSGAAAWGVPMSNQFGAFNQQNSGMSFNQQNSGMAFNQPQQQFNSQAMSFGAGANGANFNTHTSFVSAADLPSPSGALRRDTNNAGYGIGAAASTTGTQNLNAGGATGAMPTFACPHCSKLYFYQSDVDAHVAARHDAHGF